MGRHFEDQDLCPCCRHAQLDHDVIDVDGEEVAVSWCTWCGWREEQKRHVYGHAPTQKLEEGVCHK